MPSLAFPYPGYSWAMNRHVGTVSNPEVVYAFLESIVLYGREDDYSNLINEHMLKRKLLTANVRSDSGEVSLWRDYQQFLPELGLIYSTSVERRFIRLTPLSMMLIDSSITYQEFINTQVLRYQYPNGHKRNISSSVREQLAATGTVVTGNRIHADLAAGVLIKPAVLVLRILIELCKIGLENNLLSVDETIAFLMPTKINSNWKIGLAEIIKARKSVNHPNISRLDNRVRDTQEWFRLLGLTDMFILLTSSTIKLNDNHIDDLSGLEKLCEEYENEGYWLPKDEDSGWAVSWFEYYGNPNFDSRLSFSDDYDYGEDNVVIDDDIELSNNGLVKLKSFDHTNYIKKKFNTPTIDLGKYKSGRRKLEDSSILHEEIVYSLAKNLNQQGYDISSDPNSADLVAINGDVHLLFEVKTATHRSLTNRIRLGTGQLSEYRYRYQQQKRIRPISVLVLSSNFKCQPWVKSYFFDDLKMGLIVPTGNDNFGAIVMMDDLPIEAL